MTTVAASLVIWRSDPHEVLPLFRALEAQELALGRFEVLVNDDPAGTIAADLGELLAREGARMPWRVGSAATNLGYAGGHDLLLEVLFTDGFDAVLVVNPDLVPCPMAVAELARAQVPEVSLRGPVLLAAERGSLRPEGTIDSAGIRWTSTARHLDAGQGEVVGNSPTHVLRVAGVSGACLYVPRAAYRHVVDRSGEFFDTDFLAYREDAELGLRAALLGVSSWVIPTSHALHVRTLRGTKRRGVSTHVKRLGVRNRFLIAFKYGRRRPGNPVAALLRDVVVVVAAMTVERSSWPGVVEAWRLRSRMRAKGARVPASPRSDALTASLWGK